MLILILVGRSESITCDVRRFVNTLPFLITVRVSFQTPMTNRRGRSKLSHRMKVNSKQCTRNDNLLFAHGIHSLAVGPYLLATVQCELLWRLSQRTHHRKHRHGCHGSDRAAPCIDIHSLWLSASCMHQLLKRRFSQSFCFAFRKTHSPQSFVCCASTSTLASSACLEPLQANTRSMSDHINFIPPEKQQTKREPAHTEMKKRILFHSSRSIRSLGSYRKYFQFIRKFTIQILRRVRYVLNCTSNSKLENNWGTKLLLWAKKSFYLVSQLRVGFLLTQ